MICETGWNDSGEVICSVAGDEYDDFLDLRVSLVVDISLVEYTHPYHQRLLVILQIRYPLVLPGALSTLENP